MIAGLRIAVTGASGFCGGHVARRAAAAGAEVVCVGRRPGPVGRHVPWDAAAGVPDLAGADLVVHCAAAVGDAAGPAAEARMRAVNAGGTARLLEAAAGRPVVWVGSASVYDPRTDRSWVTEEHPVGHQLNAYGRTKAAGDALALAGGAVVLRPRAVYGPGDRHLLPRLLERSRGGVLALPGPDVPLSLTSVANLADACLRAFGWPPGAYNVADAQARMRDATLLRVLAAHGRPARIRHVPLPAVRAAARAAGAVARRVRGFRPVLTPYAVDQLAAPVVLDTGRARAAGWRAPYALEDWLGPAAGTGGA